MIAWNRTRTGASTTEILKNATESMTPATSGDLEQTKTIRCARARAPVPSQRTDSDRRYRDLSEFFEDRFGGSGPSEGPTIAVVGVDVACDCVLQIVDGMKAPRRIWRRVMAEKKPSTALSHEAEVGVKWNVQRG